MSPNRPGIVSTKTAAAIYRKLQDRPESTRVFAGRKVAESVKLTKQLRNAGELPEQNKKRKKK